LVEESPYPLLAARVIFFFGGPVVFETGFWKHELWVHGTVEMTISPSMDSAAGVIRELEV
jgi:hypothetical protein